MRKAFLLFTVAGCLCAGDTEPVEALHSAKHIASLYQEINNGKIQEIKDLHIEKESDKNKLVILNALKECLESEKSTLTPHQLILRSKISSEIRDIQEKYWCYYNVTLLMRMLSTLFLSAIIGIFFCVSAQSRVVS